MFKIELFENLDSTNTYLESRRNENEGLVIVAERQNNGRGQNNNKWISEKGGLYFSFLLKPSFISPVLSIMTGLTIIETLKSFGIENLKLKWPNDILYNDSKISGILIESKIKGSVPDYIIVGCGININQEIFSGVTEYNPISMKLITDKNFSNKIVLNKFLEVFKKYYQYYLNQKTELIINRVQEKIYRKDEIVKINIFDSNFIEGKIKALDNDGALIIQTKQGDKKIYSGRIIKNLST